MTLCRSFDVYKLRIFTTVHCAWNEVLSLHVLSRRFISFHWLSLHSCCLWILHLIKSECIIKHQPKTCLFLIKLCLIHSFHFTFPLFLLLISTLLLWRLCETQYKKGKMSQCMTTSCKILSAELLPLLSVPYWAIALSLRHSCHYTAC